jgi:hypothetical protein
MWVYDGQCGRVESCRVPGPAGKGAGAVSEMADRRRAISGSPVLVSTCDWRWGAPVIGVFKAVRENELWQLGGTGALWREGVPMVMRFMHSGTRLGVGSPLRGGDEGPFPGLCWDWGADLC